MASAAAVTVVATEDLKTSGDGLVLVCSSLEMVEQHPKHGGVYAPITAAIRTQCAIDSSATTAGCVVAVPSVGGGRVIYSPTGPLNRDYDDGRRWTEAASAGIKRALECGVSKVILVVVGVAEWPLAHLLGLLGALDACYVPLELREDVPERARVTQLAVFDTPASVVAAALALDAGKSAAKDIGGSDPERMAPPRVEEYMRQQLGGSSCVSMEVISDEQQLEKEYPLFAAVNRCAKHVARHQGRIILLTYTPPAPSAVTKSLYLVGKGVTYDTGGADIKAGGVMAGMHRDKCGAAAVAGYFVWLDRVKPRNIKVTGALCMVRNSVGSDCYVADEIITSRAGVRVRIGNTDAEGRMAMADMLSRMKEMALGQVDPHIMTVATLTGHCCLAMGEGYTAIMDNGPASLAGVAKTVQASGENLADPVEISTIRREDYSFHRGKSIYEDVLQSNNLPSSRTPRGHQTPAAFLVLASGLDKHGRDSTNPLKYSHVDIAASAGPFPGLPSGAPILALAGAFSPDLFAF